MKKKLEKKIESLASSIIKHPPVVWSAFIILVNELLQLLKEYLLPKSESVEDSEFRTILLMSLQFYNSTRGSFLTYFNCVFDNELINSHEILKLPKEDRLSDPKYHQLQRILMMYLRTEGGYIFNGQNYSDDLFPCISKAIENYEIEKGKFLPFLQKICSNEFAHLKYEDMTIINIPQDIKSIISKMKKHFKDLKNESLKKILKLVEGAPKQHLSDSQLKTRILTCNQDFSDADAKFILDICKKYSVTKVRDSLDCIFQQPKMLDSISIENNRTTEKTNEINSLPIISPELLMSMERVYKNGLSVSEQKVISPWASLHCGKYVKFYNNDPLLLKTLSSCSFYEESFMHEIKEKEQKLTNKKLARTLNKSEAYISKTVKKFREALIKELKFNSNLCLQDSNQNR